MRSPKHYLRDLWRGFTYSDMRRVVRKMKTPAAASCHVRLTRAELRAWAYLVMD